MAFININKVTLENTNDLKLGMANVMLLASSILYDDIEARKYEEALIYLEMLKCAIYNVEYVLKNK